MNALKCVENNPLLCSTLEDKPRDLFIHLLLSMFLTESSKKLFYRFYQSIFFPFSSSLKTRAFILSHFLWNHSMQAAQVTMNRPLCTTGSELRKGIRQWQYNCTRCIIDLPRLVLLLEFGNSRFLSTIG